MASSIAFTACDDDWSTTPLPPQGNTPTEVLVSLEYAFNNRDIDTLGAALADDFTFHFDPLDVGYDVDGYIIPDSWGRDDFLAACGNMLENAYSIESEIASESIDDPDEGIDEFTAYTILVRFSVKVDAQNGYWAQDVCDFRFVDKNEDGTDNWVISDWWDDFLYRTFESPIHVSLGWILARYYKP
ncbi:MAG: hypothetical protein JSW52_08775 [Candidatus Coatesbacteria bacterium]|nr:MAG: hypothetical protein JSW52_08775 [Candidatus Coatesbacteria bacterium]